MPHRWRTHLGYTIHTKGNKLHNSHFCHRTVVVTVPGPITTATRFRFCAEASADDDVVYTDYVVISGCKTSFSGGGDSNIVTDETQRAAQAIPGIYDIKKGQIPLLTCFGLRLWPNHRALWNMRSLT